MKTYNGHRSWNAWNVSLWISNDENLYNFALDCVTVKGHAGRKPSLGLATRRFMAEYKGLTTPDGAIYNHLSVKLALEGLND